jgi:hypothetical protein
MFFLVISSLCKLRDVDSAMEVPWKRLDVEVNIPSSQISSPWCWDIKTYKTG